jgi:hypothetical protein
MNQETIEKNMQDLLKYRSLLDGNEKSEAQVFCDRLFQAFGYAGYKEAGATLEFRIHAEDKTTKFADLLWESRLLLEMKSGEKDLQQYYGQVFRYWMYLVPHRPQYVILCNFDEFWIYDLNLQLNVPLDIVKLADLPSRYTALNFLFPDKKEPLFGNNRIAVTRDAADRIAKIFNLLVSRGEDRQRSQRFMLQILVTMFSEDTGLLPNGLLLELLNDCKRGLSSYNLIGELFRQMDNSQMARGGRYQGVRYFNGGLFKTVDPIDFNSEELELLIGAAKENWSIIHPAIFGTLFQNSMDKHDRHALGAHFTSEVDIQRVVLPTIIEPWRERIEQTNATKGLLSLRKDLENFHVLDPACGSGNFLYVAYRELIRLELELLTKLYKIASRKDRNKIRAASLINIRQFHGIDTQEFAVELAKVTLIIAKELALSEVNDWFSEQVELTIPFTTLPLDNLDENIRCDDALFCDWPKVQAIIGNPPYQSKNKMQQEFGPDYVNRVRERFPDVPGRADYCVYWFRRTQDELPVNGRAGLVGTNTIRQNYSREGGLDYIVQNGGTIYDAVSTQVWSGDAAVYVSIVNWIKGEYDHKKKLATQVGDNSDSPWKITELDKINSSLADSFDVSKAKTLKVNLAPKVCFQGQTHGRDGFLLSNELAISFLQDKNDSRVVHPYLIADNLLGNFLSQPSRFVIDLNHCDNIIDAMAYKKVFKHLEANVLPVVKEAADNERQSLGRAGPRQQHFSRWWKFWRSRSEMLTKMNALSRYIVCGRVTRRPIFEFVQPLIRPNDSLQVFGFDDDYSFGILQSYIHWTWFTARCSTLKGDWRYTSETVFNSFPWPQTPSEKQIRQVAKASTHLRDLRHDIMTKTGYTLRQLYKILESPGKNPLRDLQDNLDDMVRKAYGMTENDDVLEYLFCLNQYVSDRENNNLEVLGPGLPPFINDKSSFLSDDCVKMIES